MEIDWSKRAFSKGIITLPIATEMFIASQGLSNLWSFLERDFSSLRCRDIGEMVFNFSTADSMELLFFYRTFFLRQSQQGMDVFKQLQQIPELVRKLDPNKFTDPIYQRRNAARISKLGMIPSQLQRAKINQHRVDAIPAIAGCHRQQIELGQDRDCVFDFISKGITHENPLVAEIVFQNLISSLRSSKQMRGLVSKKNLYFNHIDNLILIEDILKRSIEDQEWSQVYLHAITYLRNAEAMSISVNEASESRNLRRIISMYTEVDAPHLMWSRHILSSYEKSWFGDRTRSDFFLYPHTAESLLGWEAMSRCPGMSSRYILWVTVQHLYLLFRAFEQSNHENLSGSNQLRTGAELQVWKLLGFFRSFGNVENILFPSKALIWDSLSFDNRFREFLFGYLPEIIVDRESYASEDHSDDVVQKIRLGPLCVGSGIDFLNHANSETRFGAVSAAEKMASRSGNWYENLYDYLYNTAVASLAFFAYYQAKNEVRKHEEIKGMVDEKFRVYRKEIDEKIERLNDRVEEESKMLDSVAAERISTEK